MTPTQAITRTRQVIRRQHKALATEETYVHWLRRYMAALRQLPESLTSEQKVERFLTHLAVKQNVSATTQNQAFNALIYFYKEVLGKPLEGIHALRAKRPARLRNAPTVQQAYALLQTVQDRAGYPTILLTRLLYGCGLRVSEPLNLRVKDLDLARGLLVIRGAKGGKDRVVGLPFSVRAELREQLARARKTWQHDQENRVPIALPHQLARNQCFGQPPR